MIFITVILFLQDNKNYHLIIVVLSNPILKFQIDWLPKSRKLGLLNRGGAFLINLTALLLISRFYKNSILKGLDNKGGQKKCWTVRESSVYRCMGNDFTYICNDFAKLGECLDVSATCLRFCFAVKDMSTVYNNPVKDIGAPPVLPVKAKRPDCHWLDMIGSCSPK